jgi:Phage integrase family
LDLVFTREDGSPIHPQTFSRSFERHAAAAKLPAISLHQMRHSHATIALRAGVHPKVVSERLRHASVAFTLDTYTDRVTGPAGDGGGAHRRARPRRLISAIGLQTACRTPMSLVGFGSNRELRGKDSNLDYLIQSQASYH